MRAIFTLAWKDLRNLITSPLFYVMGGLCCVFWTYSYLRMILVFAEKTRVNVQPGMDSGLNLQREVFLGHISLINLLFIFAVPALTMRLLSEEKRNRTYDLLLTSPITATHIAVGKFLGGLGSVAILLLISFFYPVTTLAVASFPMPPLLSAYLGALLVAASYVAVGLFASSLSESPLLSVFLGLILNLFLWFFAQGLGGETSPTVQAILDYMSFGQHFMNFSVGAVKLNSLVFFGSLIFLFVFLTQRVVESSRWR